MRNSESSQNLGMAKPLAIGIPSDMPPPLLINQAPVLTLWATVVAQRLGHSPDTALTLGRAVAGSTARLKVQIIDRKDWKPLDSKTLPSREEHEIASVTLLGKTVRLLPDSDGDLRAAFRPLPSRDGVLTDVLVPANPANVGRYLANAFGDQLANVRAAMQELAERYEPVELNQIGFRLFERFRPDRPHDNENHKTKVVLKVEKILAASTTLADCSNKQIFGIPKKKFA